MRMIWKKRMEAGMENNRYSGEMSGKMTAFKVCKNHMLYVGPLCLAAALLAMAPITAWAGPEFAHSPEKWETLRDNVLEYEELGDLIHEYNVTVINNRLEYDEYRGKDNDDLKNAYQDMADRLFASSDKMINSVSEDQPDYGSVKASAIGARLQAEQNQDQADAENEDSHVKKLEYDRQEASLVKDAQSRMNSYWQKAKGKPALEEAASTAQAQYQAMEVKAGQGMATQAELLSAREKAEAAQAAIETNEKEMDALRRELCVMTGWSYDARPELREIGIPGAEEVDSIDLAADKVRAVDANFTQAANERRLKYTGRGNQFDVMERKVENGLQQIEADVEAKYKLLRQAQADFNQAESELELAVRNAQSAERRYGLGAISRNEYMEQQGGLASKQSARDVAGLKFRQSLEDYRWAVNGLAQAEGA